MENCNTCKYCGSVEFVEKTDLIGMHWGEVICAKCDRHIRWLPDPSVTRKFEERSQTIDEALNAGILSGWELMFIRNIRERRYLTHKQQEKFDQICVKHALKIPAIASG
ncbi:MAG: hypothetical protein PUP93_25780 [Rhizonema sp. NSF051]|nr:hypothetical protein [Rhizonema sp. NSF051]